MRARITDIAYDGRDTLRLDVSGHPTEALQKAHEVAQATFGDGPWQINDIVGTMPSAATLPSDFVMKVVCKRIV